MSRGWSVLCLIACLPAVANGQPPRLPVKTVGYVLEQPDRLEHTYAKPTAYAPQPGDILLYDDYNKFFHFIFRLAHTAPPTHTSMVIANRDGKPALLELTGPQVLTAKVQIMDVDTRLNSYPGMVMVRKIRQPLTPEQSGDLTRFAEAQTGKPFAAFRVGLMATPICPRYGLRKEIFGNTYLNRNRWFCSELVVAGCVTARILPEKGCCANALFPRDLGVDERLDLSAYYHPPVLWVPESKRLEH